MSAPLAALGACGQPEPDESNGGSARLHSGEGSDVFASGGRGGACVRQARLDVPLVRAD